VVAGLLYFHKLITSPTCLTNADIDSLRAAGFADEQILNINQVAAYFAYATNCAGPWHQH